MKNHLIASQGIAIGEAFVYETKTIEAPKEEAKGASKEKEALKAALEKSSEDIKTIKANAMENLKENADIFDAHLEMVNDPEMFKQTEAMIEDQNVSAAYAYDQVSNQYIEIFNQMEDAYFKERASDIKDIKERVLSYLLNQTPKGQITTTKSDTILIAHDLTPSDTAQLDFTYVKGIITEVGGSTSHTAIMARSLSIPAIVGAKGLIKEVNPGDTVGLDALDNEIIIKPTEDKLKALKKAQETYLRKQDALKPFKQKTTKTKDGHFIPLYANIGSPEESTHLKESGAEGVGLFRTEFLFMEGDEAPDLKTQINAYKTVFDQVEPVIVRTVDIGGDKAIPYLNQAKEDNPFLGVRGLRLALQETELFKTQLKALLIASKELNAVHIMLPMVATIAEIDEAKKYLKEVTKTLDKENELYQKNIKLGIMIEIPAAAFNASELAKHVDFFSIGTNDLIQYLFAADRMNENVSYLYEPYDPTLLRLISQVIQAAHQENIHVGLCGEIASNLDLAMILTGLGIDELSMSSNSILDIRKTLADVTIKALRTLSKKALDARDAKSVKALIKTFKDENL